MRQKVVVIGCGNVGLSYIDKLCAQDNLNLEVVLIDLNTEKLKGEILDLKQGLVLTNSSIHLRIGNYEDCEDAAIVCITAGIPQSLQDRLDDLEATNQIIKNIVSKVMFYHFRGIFLVASNPLDVITYLVSYYADYPYQKVIGTGTMLDTIRLKERISEKLDIASCDIMAYVLGEHGNSQFVVWSNANIGFQNINTLLTSKEKESLAQEVKQMGKTIISYKNYTNHGIAYCLVQLTIAILLDQNCVFPVSNYHEQYNVYISTPAVIGKHGIEKRINMKLTNDEQTKMEHSVAVLHQAIASILPSELY